MKTIILTIALSLVASISWAHGNHDSGAIKPQKGGVLKSLESVHLELVHAGKQLRVYTFSTGKETKPLKVSQFPASAHVILPRKKGTVDLKLVDKGEYWETSYDAKGLHRYTLQINIKQNGHNDKVRFVVEPKH